MANERIFKIVIDGLEKSYKDTIRLVDALSGIENKTAKIKIETDGFTQSTNNSTRATQEKAKALTDEEKAEKKLLDTKKKREQLETPLAKAQALANQDLRERARELQRTVQLETASNGSIDEKRLQLISLGRQFRALSEEERNAEHIGGAMLTQIQQLREEYNQLERSLGNHAVNVGNYESATAGLVGTLDKLGNGINKTAEDTKGMLSLFQAGVGIALMFDEKNSDLAKTMNSLGKIMAIVGALQQANNLLLTKGALASKGAAIMEGVHAVQVRARATAISLATKNTLAASIAQKAFNLVAAANPYLLLAMALISVIGALILFSSNTETASEKQKRLNELQREAIELKNQSADALAKQSEQRIRELEREYELMQANGATEAQLAMKRRHINQQREKDALVIFNLFGKEASHLEENTKKADDYRKALEEINRAVSRREGKFTVEIDGKVKDLDTNAKDKIEEIKEDIEARLSNVNIDISNGLRAINGVDEVRHKMKVEEANDRKKAFEAGKRDALALAEYRVLMAKKGGHEELVAQIAVAKQRLKNDISNSEITRGERLKRTQETLQQIEKLESDFRKSQYKDEIALVDARLALVKKGTIEEFNLQSARLELQKKIELDNKELTNNEKLRIENKYLADSKKITDDYVKAVYETEISTNVSSINERLANVAQGTKEEYDLKIELAKESARLAKEEAEATIENEEQKAARIKEINAELQKEIRELSADGEVSSVSSQEKKETLSLTQELEKRTISKRAYEDKMLAISIDALQKEINIRKKYGQDTTDLEIELSEMRIDQAERERNKVTDYFEELHANMQKVVEGIMTGVNAVFDGINAVLESQLEDVQEKYDAISEKYDEVVEKREESDNRIQELEDEAKNAKGGRLLILQQQINDEMQANTQLASQEKDLAREKEKAEKEIAKKEKQQKKADLSQKIITGIANTALGVTQALGSAPPPFSFVLAALVGAAGAIQTGLMARQLAKLEDGGLLNGNRHSSGGMRIEGTNIEVEGGEYVVNRESTAKNIGLIRYINSQRKELTPDDISSYFSTGSTDYEPPFKRMFETGGEIPSVNISSGIDYRLMASAISNSVREVKIEPKVSVVEINDALGDMIDFEDWSGFTDRGGYSETKYHR